MKTKKFMTTALATFTVVSTLAIGTYLNQTSVVSAVTETTSSTTVSTTTATTTAVSHEYVWKEVYGKKYLKVDGKSVTGWVTIKDKTYFFGIDGAATTGFLENNENQTRYFFNEEGEKVVGFKKIGNINYYFKEDGTKYTGLITDESKGKKFYTYKGIQELGLKKVEDKWYYFTEDGKNKRFYNL